MELIEIQNYQVIRKVGRRLCYTVYEAVSRRDKKPCHLKILESPIVENRPWTAIEYLTSALLTKRVANNNICHVRDYGEDRGRYITVTEPLPPTTLWHQMNDGSTIPFKTAIKLAVGIANILREIHLHGLVFGALNPASIFITRDNSLKIDDLCYTWIGGALNDLDEAEALYLSFYLSPEVYFQNEAVDGRADIYSLGAILLELLLNDMSFDGDTKPSLMTDLVVASVERLEECPIKEKETLKKIIRKALEHDRERRYQNLGEFLTDMKAVSE